MKACLFLPFVLASFLFSVLYAAQRDTVLYMEKGRYAAFPVVYSDGVNVWVTFNSNTVRSHFGVSSGGKLERVWLFSPDTARTWVRKGESESFIELPDSIRYRKLPDGRFFNVNSVMNEKLPVSKRGELDAKGKIYKNWSSYISSCYRIQVLDFNNSQKKRTRYFEFADAASINSLNSPGIVTSGGNFVEAFFGQQSAYDPSTRAWALVYNSRKDSCLLYTIAYDGRHPFGEPDIIELPDSSLLALMRTKGGKTPDDLSSVEKEECGYLYSSFSKDGGITWTKPSRTEMWGYPPNLLRLKDGSLLCSYSYRRKPYGVRACFSYDNGRTWDMEHEVILRKDGLKNGTGTTEGHTGDLGYPKSVELANGKILTVYYFTIASKKTHIAATIWKN